MRKFLALFVLLILAAISIGCGNSDTGDSKSANAPGTTTYSNSSVPPSTTTAAPAQGGSSAGGAAPSPSATAPKIKPPTD